MDGAREYEQLEEIPWPVLVDDYPGTVHRTYSNEMADPTFLIDGEGKIVFYGMWTHGPTLNRAIQELLRGVQELRRTARRCDRRAPGRPGVVPAR